LLISICVLVFVLPSLQSITNKKEYINCEDEYIFEIDEINRKLTLIEDGIKTDLTVPSFSEYDIWAGKERYFDKEEYNKCVEKVILEAKKRGETVNRCITECEEGDGFDFEKEFKFDRIKGTVDVCSIHKTFEWDDAIQDYRHGGCTADEEKENPENCSKSEFICNKYQCRKQTEITKF